MKAYSVIFICWILLCLSACTKEAKQDTPVVVNPDNSETREVLLTLKNQLLLPKATKGEDSPATTKAGDQPIATAAENAISTLDVYAFAADTENGEYSFQERFAYRANPNDKLPAGATQLQLNSTGSDDKETTGLLKLKKGLFVKLYCIANDTAMVDPASGKTVSSADFTPLALSGEEEEDITVATLGKPLESTFTSYHTHLLTADAKADTLVTPLAMAGALTTPLDLTDRESATRLQAGFRLTRLVARYDIINEAGNSRFNIETVSMGNARCGSGYFPIRVYGKLPDAEPGDLITTPTRAFNGANANKGLATGAFYSYPATKQDKAFMILKGKYKVNETEMKDVSYQIPFTQRMADGTTTWLDIAGNHRYTIAITEADIYHLDATIRIDDWADDGSIDYTPDNKPGEISILIPDAWKSETTDNYDDKRKIHTVNMSLKAGSTFDFTTAANSALTIDKIYAGNATAQLYDWVKIAEPVITGNGTLSNYRYTVSLTPDYKQKRYPRTTLRIRNSIDGSESILYIEAIAVPQPEETKQPAKAPNGTSDNPNKFDPETASATMYRITNSSTDAKITCPDGIELESKPDWLDVKINENGASTIVTLTLNDRDKVVDGDQGTVTVFNRKKPELKTDIIVTLLPAEIAPTYNAVGTDNTHTPGNGADQPDDITLKVTKDNTTTVSASSMDGVKVKINYPEGSPEWLSFQGASGLRAAMLNDNSTSATVATTATAAMPMNNISLKTEQIVFTPVESKLTGAKKATVTLHNIIGGKDYCFTITPNMQPGTAEKDTKKNAVPLQNKVDKDAKTITIYQLPGEKAATSSFPITVTSLGGSILTFEKTDGKGEGIKLDKAEDTKNTAGYVITPALDAADTKITGVLHVKNYTQPDKMTDYTVTILRSDLTGTKDVTLTAQKDQSATTSISSFHGFTIDKATVDWQGGSQWFNISTTDFDGGEKKTVTFVATNVTTQVRPATVTLKNKIVDGGDLKVVVTPTYAAPTIKLEDTPAPKQNAITATNATTSTLKLYRVASSQMKVKATAIGGSTITDQTGVTVTGADTYNTDNVYTIVLNNAATSGSFKIVNKSNPDKIHTVTVQAPLTVNTAPTASKNLNVATDQYIDNTANFPEGFTVSVNWNGATANWFTLNNTTFNSGGQTIRATMKNQSGMTIKAATVTLKNKIAGGEDKTYTIAPVFQVPAISYANGNVPTQNSMSGNTVNLYQVTSSRVNVKASVLGGSYVKNKSSNITVTGGNNYNTDNTYTVTWVNGGDGWFDIANRHDANKVATRITVKALATTITASDVNLKTRLNETAAQTINSPQGCTAAINWGSGQAWFDLTATNFNANNQTLTVRAKSDFSTITNVQKATVTLTNKISGGIAKTFTVTPEFQAPTITRNGTLPEYETFDGTNLVVYRVINGYPPTSIRLDVTSLGGSRISYTGGISPSNTGSTKYAYTFLAIASTDNSQTSGTITIANNTDPNKKTVLNVTIKNNAFYKGKLSVELDKCYAAPEIMGPMIFDDRPSCPDGFRHITRDIATQYISPNYSQYADGKNMWTSDNNGMLVYYYLHPTGIKSTANKDNQYYRRCIYPK